MGKASSWKELLSNHRFKISIDFTSVISLMGYQLFIFVMINLDTRKQVFINATYSPNFGWPKQQFRNSFFDIDEYPSLCIYDRDQTFRGGFQKMLKDYFKVKLKRTVSSLSAPFLLASTVPDKICDRDI